MVGGDPGAVDGLLQITLKLGTLALASMAVFVSLDPSGSPTCA